RGFLFAMFSIMDIPSRARAQISGCPPNRNNLTATPTHRGDKHPTHQTTTAFTSKTTLQYRRTPAQHQ
ncbi:hypothetical protein, partial [Streptomyces sp. NPDC048349]|uniref:hypothetical protein n=1 Tax=Streptomyces sp. NPDC048349 TaxID=3155486 RepID=UPI003413E312